LTQALSASSRSFFCLQGLGRPLKGAKRGAFKRTGSAWKRGDAFGGYSSADGASALVQASTAGCISHTDVE
jgi:hypothetical protein